MGSDRAVEPRGNQGPESGASMAAAERRTATPAPAVAGVGSAATDTLERLNALPETALAENRALLRAAFQACRAHSLALAAPLSPEDMQIQSMPDASPTKWHLAHTTWFFETFILQHHEPGFAWFDEAFRVLFNSYYNGVGEQFPRPKRGLLSRPPAERVLAYRRDVDERMARLMERLDGREALREVAALLRLGVNHEQQHQELLLTDIKHALSQHPAWPAYRAKESAGADGASLSRPTDRNRSGGGWREIEGGTVTIGHSDEGFCFDNETPGHQELLEPYAIARAPVRNADWLTFMTDGGYDNPLLWLDEGWAWRRAEAIEAPLYWRQVDGEWRQFTLHGEVTVDPERAVAHVSYYEADAFARWAGHRLPTESEWETAARREAFDQGPLSGDPVRDEYARSWEWCASAYLPYPGFRAAPGAVGEYNGKFMVNQMVLRGQSGVTSQGHARSSYRNFFPTGARWQYSGVRLVRETRTG